MSENILVNADGKVSPVKAVDLVSKLLILVLGIMGTLTITARSRASEERKATNAVVHQIQTDLAVVRGNRWTVGQQGAFSETMAARLEKIWERVFLLESRPIPEIPPAWLKEQVDSTEQKVDANTKLLVEIKVLLDTHMNNHK